MIFLSFTTGVMYAPLMPMFPWAMGMVKKILAESKAVSKTATESDKDK